MPNNWQMVDSNFPTMTAENTLGHTGSVSYTGISGRYYRARLVMFADKGTGRGEVVTYTETLQL